MESEELLFKTTDPRGYSVALSSNRYYEHIISSDANHQAHPEFSPAQIQATIENPQIIYEAKQPQSEIYFAKSVMEYPALYLNVVISTFEDCGDVRTAFLSKSISGVVEEGGLKYVNFNNGL